MPKYILTWTEGVYCSTIVEAEDELAAAEMWEKGIDDYNVDSKPFVIDDSLVVTDV